MSPKPFADDGTGGAAPAGAVGGSGVLGHLLGGQQLTGKKEKLPAYLPVELLERLRNTVVGMQRDSSVDTPPRSLSAFVEDAVAEAIAHAENEHHGGRPYPQRPHRNLKTGPPISD